MFLLAITVLFRRELDYQVCSRVSTAMFESALTKFTLIRGSQKKYPHGKPADVAAHKKSRA